MSPFLAWRTVLVSVLLVVGVFGLFAWERALGASLAEARTVAVNALVAGEAVYLLNSRFLTAPSWTRAGLFGSRPALVAIALVFAFQVAFTYAGPAQDLFETAVVSAAAWARIGVFAVILFVLVELEKRFRGARGSSP